MLSACQQYMSGRVNEMIVLQIQRYQVFHAHGQQKRIFKQRDRQQSQLKSHKETSYVVPIILSSVNKLGDRVTKWLVLHTKADICYHIFLEDFYENYFKKLPSLFITDLNSLVGYQSISALLCESYLKDNFRRFIEVAQLCDSGRIIFFWKRFIRTTSRFIDVHNRLWF